MSVVFSLKNVSKTYGDDTLFQDLSFDVKINDRLGLMGMNGSGKSTLLKLIAGRVRPDNGELIVRSGLKCAYLDQEDRLDDAGTVAEHLYESLKHSSWEEKERHRIVQKALGRNGFTDPDQKAGTLSGGWRKKLAITMALCDPPDLVLLDEPTNHLDINGILWLEDLLKEARFSFILVSHDRSFLENTCTTLMELAPCFPSGYFRLQAGYQAFIKERDLFLAAQEKKEASLASRMRREDEWLRQGAKARSTKARYRIEQAGLLRSELSAVRQRNRAAATLDIDFEATGRRTKALLRAFHLRKAMNGKLLFDDLTFQLGPGFVLGVVGENGTGKSTFLSILEKTVSPDEGSVEWAQNLKIAVFDQARSRLNPSATLRQALCPEGGDSVHYRGGSIHVVTWAKRFLFLPDQLDMPVEKLSGGEKARVLLADIMRTPCDLLLLDEPTNDLDILSLEVLEESILQFTGAVVIVSHDRYLMDRVCNRILYLDPGEKAIFFRNFQQILDHRRNLQTREKPAKPEKPGKPEKRKPSKPLSFSFKDKYELEHIEETILAAEAETDRLSGMIQDPGVMGDPARMSRCCSELQAAQEKVQALYERWEYLERKKRG